MEIKLSVIVPVYNGEVTIKKCLKSICTYPNDDIEVIVINDGSSDKTSEIIRLFAFEDKRVLAKEIENSGVSFARNLGLSAARGTYCTFVDADDWLSENAVKTFIENIDWESADVFFYNRSFYCESCDADRLTPAISERRVIVTDGDRKWLLAKIAGYSNEKKKLDDDTFGIVACKVYETSLAKKISFRSDVKFGEDTIFAFEAARLAHEVVLCSESVYCYFINPKSVTHKNNPNIYENVQPSLSAMFEAVRPFLDDKDILQGFYRRAFYLLLLCINLSIKPSIKTDKAKETKCKLDLLLSDTFFSRAIKCCEAKNFRFKNKILLLLFRHHFISLYTLLLRLRA